MNTVNIVGRVGNTIELEKTTTGKSAVRLSVAVRRNKETTDWIKCSAYGVKADLLAQYVNKGDMIGITGSLYTEEYLDKISQKKHYATKIFINEITLIGGSKDQEKKSDEHKPMVRSVALEDILADPDDPLNLAGLSPDDLPF